MWLEVGRAGGFTGPGRAAIGGLSCSARMRREGSRDCPRREIAGVLRKVYVALVVSGVFMDMVEECRTHAEKCRELANSMTTPVDQQIFDWMAQVWEKLADLRKLDREPEPEA